MPRPKGSGNKNRSELIQYALAGLDLQIQQVQSQLDALTAKRRELSRSGASKENTSSASSAPVASKKRKAGATSSKKRKKRQVSEETRQKLSEAAQARWAKQRGEA